MPRSSFVGPNPDLSPFILGMKGLADTKWTSKFRPPYFSQARLAILQWCYGVMICYIVNNLWSSTDTSLQRAQNLFHFIFMLHFLLAECFVH